MRKVFDEEDVGFELVLTTAEVDERRADFVDFHGGVPVKAFGGS